MRRIALTIQIILSLSAAGRAGWAACSNADLKGSYGIVGTGAIVIPPNTPYTGPFARAGLAAFDGSGGIVFNTNSSYNGFIFSEPFNGTYSVQPDCSVTVKAKLPDRANLPATFGGVISANGDQVDYVLLDPPGTTINAFLVRQPKGKCQTGDLFGSYTLRASGVINWPNPLAGPFFRLGMLKASGDTSISAAARKSPGTFTVTATTSYAGDLKPETFSGTFQVNSDCTVHFEYAQPSPSGMVTSTFDGVLAEEHKQVSFVITTTGTVIGGTMIRH